MKKADKIFYLALLCLPGFAFTFAEWITFKIDNQVALQLPNQPTDVAAINPALTKHIPDFRSFVARDEIGFYLIGRFDMSNKPEVNFEKATDRKDYHDGVLDALLKDEKGTLLSQSSFPVNGGEGHEFKYKGLHQRSRKQVVKYLRSLRVGKVGYTLAFVPVDLQDSTGIAGQEQRARFFNSFVANSSSTVTK
jgi:hypothetical protein